MLLAIQYIRFRHYKLAYIEKVFFIFIHYLPEILLYLLYAFKKIFAEDIANIILQTDNDEKVTLKVNHIYEINNDVKYNLSLTTYKYLWLFKMFGIPYYIDNYKDKNICINYYIENKPDKKFLMFIKPDLQKFTIHVDNNKHEYDICFGELIYPSLLNE